MLSHSMIHLYKSQQEKSASWPQLSCSHSLCWGYMKYQVAAIKVKYENHQRQGMHTGQDWYHLNEYRSFYLVKNPCIYRWLLVTYITWVVHRFIMKNPRSLQITLKIYEKTWSTYDIIYLWIKAHEKKSV